MPHGGVSAHTRADLPGDDVTGIEPNPQAQGNPVAAGHLGGQHLGHRLDLQRRDAGPQRVVFERHRRAEQCHQAVAGELVDGSAVALDHGGGAVEQLVHDFPESLSVQRRGEFHRSDDVDEQHGHLLVLAGHRSWSDRGAAHVAEARTRPQVVAARWTPTGPAIRHSF